jgi:hypothetical protein
MKVARVVYSVFAWLFVAGVAMQVFFAGMTVVANRWAWDNHVGLGHTLALPLLVMLVTMYIGKLPGGMKRLTWLLFGVYVLQADVLIFLRASAPVLSALHPVLALADFALGLALARQATALWRASAALQSLALQPEGNAGD